MKFHIYGQKGFVELPENTTISDLQSFAFFNRVIKNYLKMDRLENGNNIEQQILDFINKDYSHTTFATRLYELFCKHDEAVKAYIKVGRKFWHYDGEKIGWRKLTVTYIRSGVMFFVFDDEPDVEQAWFMGSFNCLMMHVAEIYPYEIRDILSEWYPETGEDFPNICKQCKWDNANGEITVEVIW